MSAVIESSLPVRLVSGKEDVEIIAPKAPWLTTNDIVYEYNYAITLTDLIDSKQPRIGSGPLTVNHMDVNILTGMYDYGLRVTDMKKLADVTAPAIHINMVTGARSNIQAQIDRKVTGPGINLTGLTATPEQLNSASDLAGRLFGLISTVDELNTLHNTGVRNIDFIKLRQINATANDVDTLIGLSDLGLSPTELSYLIGVTSPIQDQLDSKSDIGHTHVVADITDLNVTAQEINFLHGTTSNIQNQFNVINQKLQPFRGGDLTAQLREVNGTATTPSYSFTNSPTTGFYRPGADQIGISVGGQIAGLINGNYFQWGTLNGNPALSNKTPSVSTPAYTFVGDNTLGLYRVGSGVMAAVGNGRTYQTWDATNNKVTVGSTDGNPEVEIAGVFSGEKLLAKPVVNMRTSANTTLFTVPTGRNCVVTKVVCVVENYAKGIGTVLPDVNLGYTSPTYADFVDSALFPGLFDKITKSGQVGVLGIGMADWNYIGTGYRRLTQNEALIARVVTPTDYSTLSVRFLVYGMEY